MLVHDQVDWIRRIGDVYNGAWGIDIGDSTISMVAEVDSSGERLTTNFRVFFKF